MESNIRPPQKKLFHNPFRSKNKLRNAQSEEVLGKSTRSREEQSSPRTPPQVDFSDSTLGQRAPEEVSEHNWFPSQNNAGDHEAVNQQGNHSQKLLPPYTLWPVPDRTSSATSSSKRETMVYQQATKPNVQEARWNGRSKTPNADTEALDEISLGFDDELLRPRSPVSPIAEAPRKSNGRRSAANKRRPSSPTEPQVKGKSKLQQQFQPPPVPMQPPTPVDSQANTSLADSSSNTKQQAEPELYSAPDSVVSRNVGLPATLGPEALAQLQVPSADRSDVLETELNLDADTDNWDIVNPNVRTEDQWDEQLYSLEKRAGQLYSADHLHLILEDPDFHSKFSTFLRKYRPWRVPLLVFYWDACKAIKALDYANSLASMLSSPNMNFQAPGHVANNQLRDAADDAFGELLRDDLHWYIANIYIEIVCSVMRSRVTGTLPAPLREASHGLAETFCITDPTRRDNPIILASQAFTRHSGCPMDYILGRNCRFMQGPATSTDSVVRFAKALKEGRDHSEIFVNYRRDGSPFLSLVMNAQLRDSRGNVRYYLGAQVDVSGLLKNCSGLESLTRLVEQQARQKQEDDLGSPHSDGSDSSSGAIKALSQMLSGSELDVINKHGGVLQKNYEHDLHQNNVSSKEATLQHHIGSSKAPVYQPRVLLADGSSDDSDQGEPDQVQPNRPIPQESIPAEHPVPEINLSGVYKYYLLVRPAPSLRVLFASPTLRTPGMLQSPFLHRIGSQRMRNDLDAAFQEPKVVTARVRWLRNLSNDGEGEGSTRWIHCTPLIHHTGKVGLWMIVVIMPNDEDASGSAHGSAPNSIRSGSRLTYHSDEQVRRRTTERVRRDRR